MKCTECNCVITQEEFDNKEHVCDKGYIFTLTENDIISELPKENLNIEINGK
jgi:hypothetical protein